MRFKGGERPCGGDAGLGPLSLHLSLLGFISRGLREWAPCSGFFFLFSHFLLVKAALLYTFSKLIKCHFGEDWLDFQSQMKSTQHKCHSAGISNSPFTHMRPLHFFAPWSQAWLCDTLWPK